MSDQKNANTLTRRRFGVLAVASAAATGLVAQGVQQRDASSTRLAPGSFQRPLVPDTPAFNGPLEFTRLDVAPSVQPFPMSQVRLLANNVYFDSQEWNRGYMARLEADRLLYTFRANAGLPSVLAHDAAYERQQRSASTGPFALRGSCPMHLQSQTAEQVRILNAAGGKDRVLVVPIGSASDLRTPSNIAVSEPRYNSGHVAQSEVNNSRAMPWIV